MNEYNKKRLKSALDMVSDLEEELVPCLADEKSVLSELTDAEEFSAAVIDGHERLLCLESCLDALRTIKNNIMHINAKM